MFDRLDTPYLARLAAAGVAPEAVTHVLLTHVHTDHVGWNMTRAEDGRWVLPNAAVRPLPTLLIMGAGFALAVGSVLATRYGPFEPLKLMA